MRALAAVVLVIGLAAPALADDRAEVGHVAIVMGGFGSDDRTGMHVAPAARAEVAFDVIGPLGLGGYLEAQLGRADLLALGGGLLVTLRPQVPTLPVQPHFELSGGRLQTPGSSQAMLDVWTLGLGGGLGVPVVDDFSIELRLRHTWLFGIPSIEHVADSGWTVSLAAVVDLR